MLRHICLLVVVLFPTALLIGQTQPSRPGYTFRELVQTGDISAAPHSLGEILESSIDDHGTIVYGADGGLFYHPVHAPASLIGEFDNPAPGGGRFAESWSSALSPSGELVFRGEVAPPGKGGLFQKSGSNIISLIPDGTIASDGQAITGQFPAINAVGDFAFINATGFNNLYLYSKGSITPIAVHGQSAPGGGTFDVISQYAINQSDQVAFISYLSPSGMGIYLASGGTITKILATGDVFPDGSTFAFPGGASINDSGAIAFGGVNNNGATPYSGLFLYSSGAYSVILPAGTTLPDGSYLNSVMGTSMNNAGQIAFACSNVLGSSVGVGTYLLSGGKLTQVAVSGQPSPDGDVFARGGELGAEINSSGQILLLSGMVHHSDTLYLFSAGQLTRIAGEGDAVPHVPKSEYPVPINISNADEVLFSDSTFPGGQGEFLAFPGTQSLNTAFIANAATNVALGSLTYMPDSVMNGSGEVAIVADTSEDYSALLLDSGNGLNVALGGPNASISPGESIGISNSGDVAFFAYGGGGGGLYLYSNGQASFLTALPGYAYSVAVNNSDSVAAFVQGASPSESGIYLYTNGVLTPLALDGAPAPGGSNFGDTFPGSQFFPAMNDSAVVFAALVGAEYQSEIFLYANNTLSRIVGSGDIASDGSTFVTADSPSINSSGEIAFWGVTTSEAGIFTYSNGVITKVVAAGDVLGTHTLESVDYPLVSDSGDIAFLTGLSNGHAAIVLARARSAGKNKTDLALSSSAPLTEGLASVRQWRSFYRRVIEVRQRRGRDSVAPYGRMPLSLTQN